MCRMSTGLLAANVMDYMKVTKTEHLEQLYTMHMAILVRIHNISYIVLFKCVFVLQRLFIRNVPEARATNFHAEFKTWIDKTYSGSLDEAQWDVIIADDRLH